MATHAPLRVYADTSVFGGCFDEEFQEWSKKLMTEFETGRMTLVLSDLTLRELEEAPSKVLEVLEDIPLGKIEQVLIDDPVRELAHQYIAEGAVGKTYLTDARHIAISTIHKVDALVSWNFKHMVNLRRIRLYNAVNLKHGYCLLEIRSPREMLNEG
jgi:hypothetical protein